MEVNTAYRVLSPLLLSIWFMVEVRKCAGSFFARLRPVFVLGWPHYVLQTRDTYLNPISPKYGLVCLQPLRLYFGYVGNLQEKVPQLTGFWLFTLIPQVVFTCVHIPTPRPSFTLDPLTSSTVP